MFSPSFFFASFVFLVLSIPILCDGPGSPLASTFPGYVRVNGTDIYPGPQFISSSIVFGLIISFFLLFILYIGVSCLTAIQRPVRFSAQPLQLAKEY
jgi:hypothetical protein